MPRLWQKIRRWLCRIGLLPEQEGIFYIGSSVVLPPPLQAQEEAEAIAGCQKGDLSCRNRLIEHNLRLVVYIARKFENTGINMEDLISIGTIGLIKAIETYNTDKKTKLATYASRCIENEILMHLRKVSSQKTEVSFEEPLSTDCDGNELLLSDILATEPDCVIRQVEDDVDRQLLLRALQRLPEREKTIISMRFGLSDGEEHTQKEVADLLGISQSYISRLEKRIIKRMKKDMMRWV